MSEPRTNTPEVTSLWDVRRGLYFSAANAVTWVIALGSPLILLLEGLGASALQVGLCYSFVFLLAPIQVLATALLPYWGYRRQLTICWLARGSFLLVPITIAFTVGEEPAPWMSWLVVGAMFMFCIFRSLGSCVYVPWLLSLLPVRLQGRYFGTDVLIHGLLGVAVLGVCALLNSVLDGFVAFGIQFTLAFIGAGVSVWCAWGIPDRPVSRSLNLRRVVQAVPELALRPGPYRYFLMLALIAVASCAPFLPFAIYYLKVESGLSDSRILMFTGAHYLGAILAALVVRVWVDRMGVRPFFCVVLLVNSSIFVYWLCLIAGVESLQSLVWLSFILLGMGQANWQSAQFKYLPQLCADDDRPLAIAVFTSAIGLIGGMAPIGLGFFLREQSVGSGMNVDAFFWYFVIALCIQLALILPFMRLREWRPDVTPLQAVGWVIRPLRSLVSLSPLFTSENDDNRRNDHEKGAGHD